MNDRNLDSIKQFETRYKARISDSSKYYNVSYPVWHKDWTDNGLPLEQIFSKEPTIEINLPREEFFGLIERDRYLSRIERDLDFSSRIMDEARMEERVRKNNPAVQLAYEKYKMLLELAK